MKPLPAALKSLWLLSVVLAFLPLAARAQLTPDWTVSTPGTAGAMIALDRGNNAYVAGWVPGSTMTLAKVGPSGEQLWQRSFDNAATLSRSTWVTVDGAGNAIVTGMILDTLNTPLGPVVLKYDSAGNLLWQDVILSISDYAVRADTDIEGNIYVLGRLSQPDAIGGTTINMAVIKYSPDGTRQWVRTFFGTNATSADSMAIAPSGNVIVTGSASGQILSTAFDPAGNQIWLEVIAGFGASDVAVGPGGEFYIVGGGSTETTGSGFLVVKHDAFFNEVWRISHPARGSAMHAVVDSAGNLVVTGAIDTNTGITTVVLLDWMTIKLDPNGALLWSRTDGENGAEVPNSMVLGPDDSIYITGEGRAPVVDPSLGGIFFLQSTLTVKYAPDGTQLWAANAPADSISVPSALQGIGVKLGSEGGVFVLGQFPQTVYRYAQGGLANQPPVAMAAARPRVGTAPLEVNFSSAGSADPDGSIAGYTWDFGDGQTSTAANPSHTYAVGSYMARLTVTDSLGAASTSAPITITASAPPPPPVPVSLTPARSTVIEGASTTATVIVSSDAGVTLALASSNTAAASVPATVVIPAGETRATFTVRTSNVRRDTVVTLSATANGATAKASLTVRSR